MRACRLADLDAESRYVKAITHYRVADGVYMDYECDHFAGFAMVRRSDIPRFRSWLRRRGGRLRVAA